MNKAAANLGSIELALVETCRQLAVSVESVKTLGAAPEEDCYSEFADAVLIAEYTEIFMSGMCLSATSRYCGQTSTCPMSNLRG